MSATTLNPPADMPKSAAPVRLRIAPAPGRLAETPGPEAATSNAPAPEALDAAPDETPGPGIYRDLGTLPPATVITESGLAEIMGKDCRESIKRAVERGELPRPVKIMGKNCWTCRAIVQHIDDRLASEARKIARLRPGA